MTTEEKTTAATVDLGTRERFDPKLAPFTAESVRQMVRIALSVGHEEIREYGVPPAFQAGAVAGLVDALEAAIADPDTPKKDIEHLEWMRGLFCSTMEVT